MPQDLHHGNQVFVRFRRNTAHRSTRVAISTYIILGPMFYGTPICDSHHWRATNSSRSTWQRHHLLASHFSTYHPTHPESLVYPQVLLMNTLQPLHHSHRSRLAIGRHQPLQQQSISSRPRDRWVDPLSVTAVQSLINFNSQHYRECSIVFHVSTIVFCVRRYVTLHRF